MRTTLLFLTIALLLTGCGSQDPAVTTGLARTHQWESMSSRIGRQFPDLNVSDAGFSRTGSLAFLPGMDRLILTGNGTFPLLVSDDYGQTWKADTTAGVTGRTYGGFSVNVDPTTNGLIIFEIKHKNIPEPSMALSIDGGETWTPFQKPSLQAHDGFSWGMANWASDNPQVILAKRHHGAPQQWLSTDGGQTWKQLEFLCRNPGVIDERTFVAGIDDSVGDVENGIYLSRDQGKTYRKVSDFTVTGKTPKRWGKNFYWTVQSGVIVSTDGGKTWRHTGGKLNGALWGPYFGNEERQMMVVTRDGFWATADGGKQWVKLADPHVPGEGPFSKSYNVVHPTACFGWDVDTGMLFASRYWWTAERMRLPAPLVE